MKPVTPSPMANTSSSTRLNLRRSPIACSLASAVAEVADGRNCINKTGHYLCHCHLAAVGPRACGVGNPQPGDAWRETGECDHGGDMRYGQDAGEIKSG